MDKKEYIKLWIEKADGDLKEKILGVRQKNIYAAGSTSRTAAGLLSKIGLTRDPAKLFVCTACLLCDV